MRSYACITVLHSHGIARHSASARVQHRQVTLQHASRYGRSPNSIKCHAQMQVDMKVEGMTCNHCTSAVGKALEASPEVLEVLKVDLQSGIATVSVQADSQTEALDKLPSLCNTIQTIGFNAEPRTDCEGGVDQAA
eukprot:jgi/Ulvmu1/10212/UM060_0012.1